MIEVYSLYFLYSHCGVLPVVKNYGVPFDHTYTGKAFVGMLDYIERMRIEDKNVLFIHTGGTPLFFDHINKKCGEG